LLLPSLLLLPSPGWRSLLLLLPMPLLRASEWKGTTSWKQPQSTRA
jgi:hypothetical protein